MTLWVGDDRPQRVGRLHVVGEDGAQAAFVFEMEDGVETRLAQIGVDEQDERARARKADGRVDGHRRLALARRARRDEQRLQLARPRRQQHRRA